MPISRAVSTSLFPTTKSIIPTPTLLYTTVPLLSHRHRLSSFFFFSVSEELPERGRKGRLNLELFGLDAGDDERRLLSPKTDVMEGVFPVRSVLDPDVVDAKLSVSDSSIFCR